MARRFKDTMEAGVFYPSAILLIAFLLYGTLFSDTARGMFVFLQDRIIAAFGWFYVLAVSLFLVFALWVAMSRYGHVPLGSYEQAPKYRLGSWFAMLFAAGMGIGLVFWGAAEPPLHYVDPPVGEGETDAAALTAMRFTFLHWGLHPWAVYAVLGLALAYFHHRHKLPLAPRSVLYPIIGNRIYGPIGHTVDVVSVIATLFGLATSLGLGALQINTGLARLAGAPEGTVPQLLIVAAITVIAAVSVFLGVQRGIRVLSVTNMFLALALLVFVLMVGPTLFVMNLFLTSTGDYVQNLVSMSLWTGEFANTDWQASWTLFYWGWWISWAPFVGTFIARISVGRTIREFVAGVLLVPTLVGLLWFSVFGGSALHMQLNGITDVAGAAADDLSLPLYVMLEALPLSTITSAAATVLVAIFFVTSMDSGALVVDGLASGGRVRTAPMQRVFWAVAGGAVAAVLLLAGGLRALQMAAITAGFPMAIIMLTMLFGVGRALKADLEGRPFLGLKHPGGPEDEGPLP